MSRHSYAHNQRYRRLGVLWTGVLCTLATCGLALAAADQVKYPIFTPTNFIDSMKTVGVNFSAVNMAISNKDFQTAKGQLIRTRERMALTITFWRDRQKDDAVKLLRDGLRGMDELDTLLSANPVDPSAASAAVKQIGANCQSCHALYREQDASTHSYRFKPGLVESK